MKRDFSDIYQEARLAKRYLLGEMNEDESQEFEQKMAQDKAMRQAVDELRESDVLKQHFDSHNRFSAEKAYRHFRHRVDAPKRKSSLHLYAKLWRVAVAACIGLLLGLTWYFMAEHKGQKLRPTISAGSQMAQLRLTDGETLEMKDNELITSVAGVQVLYKEGVLTYQLPDESQPQHPSDDTPTAADKTAAAQRGEKSDGQHPHGAADQLQGKGEEKTNGDARNQLHDDSDPSNELTIPLGAENSVRLSDGTLVCLNAGSRLIYPVRFKGKRRTVRLEGEGFFQVKADAQHPFVVQTPYGEVTALGTSFNVHAYHEDGECRTTLVSGIVTCQSSNNQTLTLQPGEQATFSDGNMHKKVVETDEYTGWATGTYTFRNRTLEEIMTTFSRWYDIQVVYHTPSLRQITYTGNFNRHNSINAFLNALELTGDLHYSIKGRTIIIE